MNPENPPTPREKIEMRLTALLMGELPPEEAAALDLQMAAEPELAALHGRLREAMELLREATAFPEQSAPPTPLQLSSERRERLLAHFKTPTPAPASAPVVKKPRRDWSWALPLSLAAAVIVAVGVGLMMPVYSEVRVKGRITARRGLLVESEEGRVGPVTTFGPINSSSAAGSAGASTANVSALSTPAPQEPQLNTMLIASNGGSAVAVPQLEDINITGNTRTKDKVIRREVPQLVTSSSLGTKSAANVDIPPAEKPPTLNLGKVEVANTGETTANFQLQDRAIPEDQKRPFATDVNGTVGVIINGGATLALTGSNTYTGGTTVSGGTLTITNGSSNTSTISGTITGSGGVAANSNIDTLNHSNTYGGATTVNGGTLDLNGWSESAGSLESKNVFTGGGTVGTALPAEGFPFQGGTLANTAKKAPAPPMAGKMLSTPAPSDANRITVIAGGTLAVTGDGILSLAPPLQSAASGGAKPATPPPPLQYAFTRREKPAPAAQPAAVEELATLKMEESLKEDPKLGRALSEDERRAGLLEKAQAPTAAPQPTPEGKPKQDRLYTSVDELTAMPGDRPLKDVELKVQAQASAARAKATKDVDLAWARPARKSSAATEIQQDNLKELDFGWLKDAKAPEENEPLVAQSKSLRQDIPKLLQDMVAAAPKNEEVRSLLAKYGYVDKPPGVPAPHSVTSSASAQVPAPIDKLAGTEIAQQAGPSLLRDMAVASLKNKEIRELLAKHGYTVQQPATPASGVNKSVEEASDKRNASPAPIPPPEIPTSANAFSTFSLNVSDVSFKLAEASLQKGRMPDPGTVRSEEFINSFDYRDPEPAPGVPLAFAAERARYPFAQNRDLLRFSVKTAAAGRQPGRPLNIVLLLDKSGSMERADRVNIVREALRILAAQLQPQDKLSIVTFARTPRLWADGVAGDKAGEVIARVGEIMPEGGTNLEAALDLGYATAQRHYAAGSINRVVLFTDGAANLGDVDPDALAKKVETHRKQGVALDCFGIGWEGYNDDLLEQLTRHGDGRYGFINTPDEAAANFAAQLAGALRVAASDVKVQVEFNPKRVTAYRQIGYAKHQLTKEQFRDNSVAAAQIGAAESGNALYVVEVDPRGEGDLATVRVRFRVPGTSDYREHEWTVPFSGNVPPLEQASSALRLAGAASAFSEMLAVSPYATEVTSDRLLGVLEGIPAIYGADPRPKQLEWMIRQARSLSGR